MGRLAGGGHYKGFSPVSDRRAFMSFGYGFSVTRDRGRRWRELRDLPVQPRRALLWRLMCGGVRSDFAVGRAGQLSGCAGARIRQDGRELLLVRFTRALKPAPEDVDGRADDLLARHVRVIAPPHREPCQP